MADSTTRPDHPRHGLVAIDLDGTLLGPGGVLTPRSAEAVRATATAGWTVALATGRPPHLVTHLSGDLAGSVDYVVGGNGSLIATFPDEPDGSGHLLHLASFDMETARRIVRGLRDAVPGIGFALATDGGFGHEPGFAERMPAPVDDDPIDDVLGLDGELVFKLLTFHPDHGVDELLAALPPIVASITVDGGADRAGGFTVAHMGADAAEIGPAAVDKRAGLQWLCDHVGIGRADVIAFGDEGNDRTMIEWAGVGYAMANAAAEVLAVADRIAPHHADDGVAQVLEQLVTTVGQSPPR